jgi:hypothetical protein
MMLKVAKGLVRELETLHRTRSAGTQISREQLRFAIVDLFAEDMGVATNVAARTAGAGSAYRQ